MMYVTQNTWQVQSKAELLLVETKYIWIQKNSSEKIMVTKCTSCFMRHFLATHRYQQQGLLEPILMISDTLTWEHGSFMETAKELQPMLTLVSWCHILWTN